MRIRVDQIDIYFSTSYGYAFAMAQHFLQQTTGSGISFPPVPPGLILRHHLSNERASCAPRRLYHSSGLRLTYWDSYYWHAQKHAVHIRQNDLGITFWLPDGSPPAESREAWEQEAIRAWQSGISYLNQVFAQFRPPIGNPEAAVLTWYARRQGYLPPHFRLDRFGQMELAEHCPQCQYWPGTVPTLRHTASLRHLAHVCQVPSKELRAQARTLKSMTALKEAA